MPPKAKERIEELRTGQARERLGVSDRRMRHLIRQGVFTMTRYAGESLRRFLSDELDLFVSLAGQEDTIRFAKVREYRLKHKRVKMLRPGE